MPDLEKLSRPFRRVLAEWLTRLIERLTNLQNQLRFGLIRLVSTSVAETIEEQLHRPFKSRSPNEYYEDGDYLDYDEDPVHPRLSYSHPDESSYSPRDTWRTVLTRAAQRILQWLQHPWVEPVVAGSVTLMSLLLLVG
ncbi:MAG TPA: hypothetical protein PLX97_05225 [Gemmatales bacterium]|nr:hypothetical protein [Gemmatales bacterium]